ncbi:hypothetical protein SISSUDRAFT_1036445 [Sistotremastrum suecicum HHB10207 ss-3]|uniref:Uncharacterized protein n=1 Tax=Sistotremastrum suecicum HHB10207 ss-3 TaxID=1314776 RepID=A0A165ZEQ9_9AGAM|nr:hypothetical protein SISSUDRAFT_1036445 [Sistotremastrum suecicum HHB10207 ss-3]
MTDLTYCYLHMTDANIETLDTLDSIEYIDGQLSDEELEIPEHMVPPNPDDGDVLPSEVHPSYPYGNPFSLNHPASLPRRPHDPTSRTLYEDMDYNGTGDVNAALRWKDLALDRLLPVDEVSQEQERAANARKMASGTTAQNTGPQPPPPQNAPEQEGDEGDDDDFHGSDEEIEDDGDNDELEGDSILEPSFEEDDEDPEEY